jgi:UDP-glucose:(heptosyl)LPS alpha-1,3-glucosyltransferase
MPAVKRSIAIVIERLSVALGGAERSVVEMSRALARLDLDVHILAAKGQSAARNVHILCEKTRGKRTWYFTFKNALQEHLLQNHYDIIHSTMPFGFADIYQPRGGSFAESIIRNAASYGNPFIGAYKRLTAFANYRRTLLLNAERKLCKDPGGPVVVALSDYVARQFTQHYGLNDARVTVIANGVKVNRQIDAARADKLRSQIMRSLGLRESDQPRFFLFAANNFRLKGLGPLIRAMSSAVARIGKRCPYLLAAGSGSSGSYRRLARRLNIDKRIVFLGPLRAIEDALSIADVAVLPTFYDPASRFVLEALAVAKPVITTKFNGASDLFVSGRHGIVVDEPENIDALAEAIIYFADPDNVKRASAAIMEDNVREKVSIDRVARDLLVLYTSLDKGR